MGTRGEWARLFHFWDTVPSLADVRNQHYCVHAKHIESACPSEDGTRYMSSAAPESSLNVHRWQASERTGWGKQMGWGKDLALNMDYRHPHASQI